MKTRTLVSILILIVAVPIMAGSCATRRKAISEEDFFEAWSGTWINTDYGGGNTGQKIINHPDGTREIFGMLTSKIVGRKEKCTVLYQWLDSKGTIWYRGNWECLTPNRSKGNEMGKITYRGMGTK